MSLKVKLLEYTPNPERVVAAAAKLCYSQVGVDEILEKFDEEKIHKFLDMIMSYGHQSTIEHISFSFAIEGVSRSLTHQLVRHRLASYSQQSQRYVKLAQFEYIIPPEIGKNEKAKYIFINSMKRIQEDYDALVDILFNEALDDYSNEFIIKNKLNSIDEISEKDYKRLKGKAEKKAIEDARYVFPNACETKIIVTMNARELLHFFNHRCCNRAQWEIRALANEMLKQVKDTAPILFKFAGPSCLKGLCPEGNMTCGKIKEVRAMYKSNSI
ncbi:MAG: FAD-dependent thymidylate synthase [Bacillota bacterium]|nr:FAD-dependent thymidylate synthase [Bacillota bacterium]